VPGAELIIRPFKPYLARKHASDAPAGPAPTIRRSVSSVTEAGEECVIPLMGVEYMGVIEAMVVSIIEVNLNVKICSMRRFHLPKVLGWNVDRRLSKG
jgi:hypothetical protein